MSGQHETSWNGGLSALDSPRGIYTPRALDSDDEQLDLDFTTSPPDPPAPSSSLSAASLHDLCVALIADSLCRPLRSSAVDLSLLPEESVAAVFEVVYKRGALTPANLAAFLDSEHDALIDIIRRIRFDVAAALPPPSAVLCRPTKW